MNEASGQPQIKLIDDRNARHAAGSVRPTRPWAVHCRGREASPRLPFDGRGMMGPRRFEATTGRPGLPRRHRPAMLARIGVMQALNRHVVREFNPDRKDHHFGEAEAPFIAWSCASLYSAPRQKPRADQIAPSFVCLGAVGYHIKRNWCGTKPCLNLFQIHWTSSRNRRLSPRPAFAGFQRYGRGYGLL
jgi:hypothetical protein